jgi:hypothetical protein
MNLTLRRLKFIFFVTFLANVNGVDFGGEHAANGGQVNQVEEG